MEQQPSTSGVSAKKSKHDEPCVFSGKYSDKKCFCHTLLTCIMNKKKARNAQEDPIIELQPNLKLSGSRDDNDSNNDTDSSSGSTNGNDILGEKSGKYYNK